MLHPESGPEQSFLAKLPEFPQPLGENVFDGTISEAVYAWNICVHDVHWSQRGMIVASPASRDPAPRWILARIAFSSADCQSPDGWRPSPHRSTRAIVLIVRHSACGSRLAALRRRD
jgi:hypothetical protein